MFLYTNKDQSENENSLIYNRTKIINYLGVNISKYLHIENHKTLLKQVKKAQKYGKASHGHG